MNKNFLFEERQRKFNHYDKEMRRVRWQEEVDENIKIRQIASIIRKKLLEKNPMAFKYFSVLEINALATKIAPKVEIEPVEDDITIMPFDMLMQAKKEQPGWIKTAGDDVSKKKYFALICETEDSVTIGVYVPKPLRQLEIERIVEASLSDLDAFLKRIGKTPNEEIRAILSNYLLRQSYPRKTSKIKIYVEKHELKGEYDIAFWGNNRKIQMSYDKKAFVLRYHIV